MPSGPKKRARARRKKAGSPSATTDANSDRETEALSVTGSMDVDDMESGLDTPRTSVRPSFLDRATLSSQTDEWVRVSNFDVGTPTSQTGEEGDASSSSRRSLDKLAEWETVSEEQTPERQEGSINSLEEEPSEVEVASGHSSESFTHLPSPPHPAEGGGAKDHTSHTSEKVQKRETKNRSSCSSSYSSSSSEEKSPLAAAGTGDVFVAPLPLSSGEEKGDEAKRSGEDSIEKEMIVHGTASSDKNPTASNVPSHPAEEVITLSSAKDISEVDTLSIVPGPEESVVREDKEVLPIQAKEEEGDEKSYSSVVTEGSEGNSNEEVKMAYSSVTKEGSELVNKEEGDGKMSYSSVFMTPGLEKEGPTSSSHVGVKDKQLDVDKKVSPAVGEDKGVVGAASTSAGAQEGEKSKDFELPTLVGKNSSHMEELGAHSGSEKALPASGTSGSLDAPASATPGEKNGTDKPLLEVKPLSGGCCGVIYWLLGWDH